MSAELIERLKFRHAQTVKFIKDLKYDYSQRWVSESSRADCPHIREQYEDQQTLADILTDAISALSQAAKPEQQTAPQLSMIQHPNGESIIDLPEADEREHAPGCVCGRPQEPICNDTFNGAPGSDDDCGNIGQDENGKFYCGHSRACHDSGKEAR